ncbi:MAG: DUF423 domain-containing protein [Planctomycetota bacterium]
MRPSWISIGAVWAALAVGLGAFGAHGLKSLDPGPEAIDWWKTAASYHLWHALGLIAFGLLAELREGTGPWTGRLLLVGSAIFSGTLYAMALGAPRWFGAITPIGGTALILGWLAFARAGCSRPTR